MVAPPYEDLPRKVRRRLLARALLRPAAAAGGLLALYYWLPFTSSWGGRTLASFLFGLVALVVLVAWQARAIATARYPRLRGIEALATAVVFFLILFASMYFVAGRTQAGAFSEELSRTDALYLAVTIFTSVGFGDIVARSTGARVMVMVQMLGSVALLGIGVRILLTAVQTGLGKARGHGD